MVSKLKTKQEIRREMERQVWRFIDNGGRIQQVQRGISGYDISQALKQSLAFTLSEKQPRTALTDIIKQLDQRKIKSKPASPVRKQPGKKIIYDDFGEPVREVWE